MLNRKLLANGYAYEYTYNVPYKYQKEFKSLEEFAKKSKNVDCGRVQLVTNNNMMHTILDIFKS